MNPQFDLIQTRPENQIFKVVFFPDRIYHASYLNATRSPRYRYNVMEVRSKFDITVLKGQVYMDGRFLCNFVRIEYRASRLVETSREAGRLCQDRMRAYINLRPLNGPAVDATVKLHLCRWTDSYQVELWETLEPPSGTYHDYGILDQIGRDAPITRVPKFAAAMQDMKALRHIELAFSEDTMERVRGYRITEPRWDNNFTSSHQEPVTNEPSSDANTISDQNYLIDFQRGYFLDSAKVPPVRYRNAMMDMTNPDRFQDNIIEMRWLVQREFGGSVIFFHEVTIPPHTVEGTHQHIGSEELYYITEGRGIAYLGENDDPALADIPIVERDIFGLGMRECREVEVYPGCVIFTKSGGIHGIRNLQDAPLKFVAFLYHSA